MKPNKILYSSTEIRKTIIDIFSKSKGRRVAITAFVGSGAEAYLPKPKGIELICWPKAGGTNPDALRKIIKNGVEVSFADALHMKIYWTEDNGAVITSANLSTNALGAGNLKEIGILVPSDQIDIDRIIQKVKPSRVTKKDLAQLDTAHREYHKINKMRRANKEDLSFLEWSDLPMPSEWKIGYWDKEIPTSLAVKRKSKEQYNVADPEDFLGCRANTYKENDWILTFQFKSNMPINLSWLYVDFLAKTEKSDKAYIFGFPYQAVQVWPVSRYPRPPFKIDKRFRDTLAVAIKKYGISKFKKDDPYKLSKNSIELIQKNY